MLDALVEDLILLPLQFSSSLPTKSAHSLPPHSLNSITRHSSLCQTCLFSNPYWNANTLYMSILVRILQRQADRKIIRNWLTWFRSWKKVPRCTVNKTETQGIECVVPDWIQRAEKQENMWLKFQFETRDPRRANVSVQVQRLEKIIDGAQSSEKRSLLLSLFVLIKSSND